MFIQSLDIRHFRGLPSFSIALHERLNVFIGDNGIGKSSLLDFLSIMISQCRLLFEEPFSASLSDINKKKTFFDGRICCKFEDSFLLSEYRYDVNSTTSRCFENTTGNFEDEKNENGAIYQLYNALKGEEIPFSHNFPLVVFYPTNRGIFDIPERIRGFRPVFHPFDALENALSSTLDFRSFIAMFRQSEQALFHRQGSLLSDAYTEWQARQVRAVNSAISSVVPEFKGLHVSRKPFRISITKQHEEFDFMQLSDGEKCLIALLGDLAQRLAVANPTLKNPLEGKGIVLIDELELHLHPIWQSALMGKLAGVFPGCQFIVTTHSPLVLGGIRAESIWIMSENESPYHPDRSYGMDSSELLREVMGANSRNAEVEKALEDIDRLVNDEQFEEARIAIRRLASQTGAIPAIHEANGYLTMMGGEQAEIGE